MAKLETTIHIADIEEVKAVLDCTIKLVTAIKECNSNTNSGLPLELTAPYHSLVSAIDSLKETK
ncbi:MAG TPA: hypothetical protein VFC84_00280 [Desulfosporosinus sp.]|nr:hypothetical protein [Desulfosporosinus sp.]